jgi:hypothetical protein
MNIKNNKNSQSNHSNNNPSSSRLGGSFSMNKFESLNIMWEDQRLRYSSTNINNENNKKRESSIGNS